MHVDTCKWYLIQLYCCVIFHYVNIPTIIYPVSSPCKLAFLVDSRFKNFPMNILVNFSCCRYQGLPGSGTAGLQGM